MATLPFYIVDVFAEEKYAGNQLAVVRGAGNLTAERMQQIAQEFHFSETPFLVSDQPRDGGYDVKIFTPRQEVPFAGHPTLGSAYIIKHYISASETYTLKLNLGVGQITVSFQKNPQGQEVVWMKQKSPQFGETFTIAELAQILQLPQDSFDGRFPIQEVRTGLPFMIVPLKTLAAVKSARVNLAVLQRMSNRVHGGILVFCPQTYRQENNLNVRVFVDLFGIPEDPATGSANGCLAGYLSRYQYFGSSQIDVRVEQGYEVQRPSLLMLKANCVGDQIEVFVGGKVQLVACGTLI